MGTLSSSWRSLQRCSIVGITIASITHDAPSKAVGDVRWCSTPSCSTYAQTISLDESREVSPAVQPGVVAPWDISHCAQVATTAKRARAGEACGQLDAATRCRASVVQRKGNVTTDPRIE